MQPGWVATTMAGAPGTASEDPARAKRGWRGRVPRLPRPALLTGVVLFAAYFGYVAIATRLMPLNSDKVWAQTDLALRGRFGVPFVGTSPDNFTLKYPVYQFAQQVFGLTFRAVAFEVFVQNLVLFASIAVAYGLLVRTGVLRRAPWPLVVLTGLWTISICDPTGPLRNPVAQPTVTLIHPNERNLELGLAILVLVVEGLLDAGRIGSALRPPARLAVVTGLGLAAGLIWFDDPYEAYVMLVPLAAVALVRAVRARQPRRMIAAPAPWLWYFIAVSIGGYLASRAIAGHFGLHPALTSTNFAPVSDLGPALRGAFSSLFAMYDGSLGTGSIRLLLNAVLAAVVVASGLVMLAHWLRTRNSAAAVLPLAAIVIAAAFVASGSARFPQHVRYLIVFVPVFFIVLPGALTALAHRRVGRLLVGGLCALFVVSALFNAVHTEHASGAALSRPGVNDPLYKRSRIIGDLGLGKGYASYWNAQINTYVSRGRQLTIPVHCVDGTLRIRIWLMDTAWMDKPAARTYLIRQPGDPALRGCGPTELTRQFGRPAETESLPGGQQLLAYDYDIASRMLTGEQRTMKG